MEIDTTTKEADISVIFEDPVVEFGTSLRVETSELSVQFPELKKVRVEIIKPSFDLTHNYIFLIREFFSRLKILISINWGETSISEVCGLALQTMNSRIMLYLDKK